MSNVTPNLKLNKFGGNLALLDEVSRHVANDANLDAIDAAVGSGGGSGSSSSPIQVATVTLTSAQIKSLVGTPVQLVAAPGAGKIIVPFEIIYQYKYGGVPYSIAGVEGFEIDLGGADCSLTVALSGFLDQTVDTIAILGGPSSPHVAAASASNAPLTLKNDNGGSSGDVTAGDGALVVTVFYAVVNLS